MSEAWAGKLLGEYLTAFKAANPASDAPALAYENGWWVFRFRMSGSNPHRVRTAQLQIMLDRLKGRKQ